MTTSEALKELSVRYSALGIYEKRSASDVYCECVFFSKDLPLWQKIFDDVLGPAVKPEKIRPSKEHLALTKEHGGIEANQVLFKKDFDDAVIVAMLWPWGDRQHITVKIAVVKNQG